MKIEDAEMWLGAIRRRGKDDAARFAGGKIEQIVRISPRLVRLQHDEEGETGGGDIDFKLTVLQRAD